MTPTPSPSRAPQALAVSLEDWRVDEIAHKHGDYDVRNVCFSFSADNQCRYHLYDFVQECISAALAATPAPAPQVVAEPVGEIVGTEKRGFALMTLVRWEPGFNRNKIGTLLYAHPAESDAARTALRAALEAKP